MTEEGASAPDFTLPSDSVESLTLSSLRGSSSIHGTARTQVIEVDRECASAQALLSRRTRVH